MADPNLTLVRVRCRNQQGMWRCDKFWPSSFVEAMVTDEQLAELQAEQYLFVHLAASRNADLPSVNDVQPTLEDPPAPVPWGDTQLEALRQEAIALDEQAAAKAADFERARAAAAEAESDARTVSAAAKKK